MGFIQVTYIPKYGYLEENFSDFGFQMLGMFLKGEVGAESKFYKNWLLDSHQSSTFGNFVGIRKKNGYVTLYFGSVMDVTDEQRIDWILQNDPQDADDEFCMPMDDFLHVMDFWVTAQMLSYKEIWIKCEDGVYWVEGIAPMR